MPQKRDPHTLWCVDGPEPKVRNLIERESKSFCPMGSAGTAGSLQIAPTRRETGLITERSKR